MKLVVLAGGFGSRLRAALPGVPKALAPVGKVPFLRLQLEHWISQGMSSCLFLLQYQAAAIVDFLGAQRDALLSGVDVQWIQEPEPLGTGGAIANAVRQGRVTGSFLLTNADTWLGNGLRALCGMAVPAMAAVQVPDTSRYGALQIGADGLVTKFSEKAPAAGPGWINAGLYHLHGGSFEGWDGAAFSLEHGMLAALAARRELRALKVECAFIDIGVPGDYAEFCRWHLSGRKGVLCS